MAKPLHPRLQELRDRIAGEYLASRYEMAVDMRVSAIEEEDEWIIKGYLAVFNVKDSYGTRAIKGCFAKSIKERGPDSKAKNKIIHLFMHDTKEPIGQYRVLREDDYGLYFECVVDKVPNSTCERVYLQTRSGTLNQFSYGFDYVWDKMEWNDKAGTIDMFECALFEGTSVSIKAANPETYAIRSKEDFEARLKQLGQEAEELISGLSINQQIGIRQLITSYKSLAEYKPVAEQPKPLDLSIRQADQADVMVVGSYKINKKQFN